jgi:S-DNA-T family DNA segregation ATPase FtsK/SpoIIIE
LFTRFWTCFFPICSIVFLDRTLYDCRHISKKLKGIWFWDLFALIILSILFGFFATSLPELGGTVGYELNLFLQDYIGKNRNFTCTTFGLIIYVIFKIKLSRKNSVIFRKHQKEIKSDLGSNTNVKGEAPII